MKLDHDELMVRTFVTDNVGNVFSLPIGPDFNAILQAGEAPPGFEMVVGGINVNPRYQHLVSAALSLYQVSQAAKVMIEAHMRAAENAGQVELSLAFEQMAANLNLAQRAALEGPSLLSSSDTK